MAVRTYQKSVLFIAVCAFFVSLSAQEEEEDANAKWECRQCPDYTGVEAWVEPSVGYQDEDSYRFGRYTGLKDEGVFGNGSAQMRYRNEDAWYLDIRGSNLGLDSRDVEMEGGKQGSYEFSIEYDQLPNLQDDTTVSPFHGRTGNRLFLQPNWVPATNTQNMTALDESLNDVTLKSERKRFATGFSLVPFKNWEISGNFSHQKKDGRDALGSTFGFSQSALLPVPIDYETNAFDLAIGYAGKKFQGQIAYHGSLFNDANASLVWQNPYADPSDPNGFGRMALPPDNESHQLSATLGYDVLDNTRANVHLAYGRMTQDESFLPYTINPTLSTSPLPNSDLDGKVNTTLAQLELNSRPTPKLRLDAAYTYSDRDNDSDKETYEYVVTDLALAPVARTNLPYSFKQHVVALSAGYRLPKRSDVSVGFDYDKMDYNFQEVSDTTDKTLWAKLKTHPHKLISTTLKYAYSDRSNSDYEAVPQLEPPQNPLMRLYNLAERDRNEASVSVSIMASEAFTVELTGGYYQDDYDETALGLEEAENFNSTVDFSYLPSERFMTYAYYTLEYLRSNWAGSQAFGSPDWFQKDRNITDTVGVGFTWAAMPKKLDVGSEFVWSKYRGKIRFRDATNLPNLESKLWGIRLYGTYKLKESMSLKLAYLHQHYDEDNWSIDNIGVDTLPTVLSLGAEEQEYDVDLVTVSLRYEFE